MISKEELRQLYEKDKLTTFQISEKIGCCQTTIWKKLKEYDIKPRLPGVKRVEISKEKLEELYLGRKLSTWKMEKMLNIPRGTIHRKMKEFGISTRDLSESHIIHPKKDFSGNLLEKAYLIGFRIGDLGVRKIYPNSRTICVASGSTIKEQIELINSLFNTYAKVWISKPKNNKINIQVSLNESFNFLISKEYPQWIENDRNTFFSFLAGFTDAEGNISINQNMDYYGLGNYNKKILFNIYKNLNTFGIKCRKPTQDNRKGKTNSQGYKYNSNYWALRIQNKSNLLQLLLELKPHIKHKQKVKALNNAISNIQDRNNGIYKWKKTSSI
ncbi:MAG: LAGLIDADG family homing endonuclease [Nanoarchaeota archaeon]|nr:LAGLIDADG family homing endonuclease [Nanoarchaeota archaeon]